MQGPCRRFGWVGLPTLLPLCLAFCVRPLSMRDNFYPALQRRWGEISGPYLLQADGCKSINGGVARFNQYMGFEALRVLFRGRDESDPQVTAGRVGWVGDSIHILMS